jgi:hypothetical protein
MRNSVWNHVRPQTLDVADLSSVQDAGPYITSTMFYGQHNAYQKEKAQGLLASRLLSCHTSESNSELHVTT